MLIHHQPEFSSSDDDSDSDSDIASATEERIDYEVMDELGSAPDANYELYRLLDREAEDGRGSDDSNDELGPLLDLEAEEGSSSDDDSDNGEVLPENMFPQFPQFPLELRLRIWELFCPGLDGSSRVLPFELSPPTATMERNFRRPTRSRFSSSSFFYHSAKSTFVLEDVTRAQRVLMAVCSHTRDLVHKSFPDTLTVDSYFEGDDSSPTIDHDGESQYYGFKHGALVKFVRFNKHRDIIWLNGPGAPISESVDPHPPPILPGFAENITQIAYAPWFEEGHAMRISELFEQLSQFTALESVFLVDSPSSRHYRTKMVSWCTSERSKWFCMETFEKEPGFGEDTQSFVCWPDPAETRFHDLHKEAVRYRAPEDVRNEMEEQRYRYYPMMFFDSPTEFDEFCEKLVEKENKLRLENPGSDVPSSSSTSSESEEESFYGDDGDDFVVPDEAPDLVDHPGESDDASSETLDAPQLVPAGGGAFSSPESSPEPEQEEQEAPANRGRKRRVVEDSDDSDADTSAPPAKRTRHVVVSDDSDADASAPLAKSPRHVIISDDEGEDNEEGSRPGPSTRQPITISSSASEPSIDMDDNEPADNAQPQLTLAERLANFRQENPIPSSSEESEQGEESEPESDIVDFDEVTNSDVSGEEDSEGGGGHGGVERENRGRIYPPELFDESADEGSEDASDSEDEEEY